MHVLIITPGFAVNESDDFTISALQEYVKELISRPGVEITIFTIDFPYTKKSYTYFGANVIPFNGKNRKWNALKIQHSIFKSATEIHKNNPFDLIHAFWLSKATRIGVKLKNKLKIGLISSAFGQDVLNKNKYLPKINFDQFITIYSSQFQMNKASKLIGKSAIIHLGLNYEALPNPVPSKTIDVMGIGNLSEVKNWNLFIDVVKEVKKSHPGIVAKIIGGGKEGKRLQKRIAKEGLSENIELLGWLSRNKTLEYLSQTKILLHTSNYESFGMIFMESEGLGVHIVSTPVGIAAEMKHVKRANDTQGLASKIVEIWEDENNPKQSYPIQTTVDQYLRLYTRMIPQGKGD